MAITGWREISGLCRGATGRKGRELSGGIIGPREAVPSRAVCGRGARRGVGGGGLGDRGQGLGQPALDQVRSANQAASNQPVGGARTRPTTTRVNEFVPTALPRCWLAGQSGHAGHGVRSMAGDSLSTKVNSPPTGGR